MPPVRLLIVAATAFEVAPLATALALPMERAMVRRGAYRGVAVDVLVAGVGAVATAAWCSKLLSSETYDLALNFGVCGSFDATLRPGDVVHVTTDRLADLGAEDGDRFLSAHDLQLLSLDEFPYVGGRLVNEHPPANTVLAALPAVDGITVNTAHGAERSIADVVERLHPQVESMEGAAFMYSCLIAGVPFAQVRSISNPVERRNRAAWKMPLAIERLGQTALAMLQAL